MRIIQQVVGLSLLLAGSAAAQAPAPLYTDLGNHQHRISTSVAKAQTYFNQGLRLTYGFNHAEAIRTYEAEAKVDKNCAIAWCGVALAYAQNINAPMGDDAVPKSR